MSKFNLRESLLTLDKETDFEYNLLSDYEAQSFTDEQKKQLVEMIIKKSSVEHISSFLNESIVHMRSEHEFAPLEFASTLEVGDRVYDKEDGNILTVKDIDKSKKYWVQITFVDENGNEQVQQPGVNYMYEVVGDNDTAYEVDDDIDIEWHPISDYFSDDLDESLDNTLNESIDEDIDTNSADFIVDIYEVDPNDEEISPIGEPIKIGVSVDEIIKEYGQKAYDTYTKEMTSDYVDSDKFRYSTLNHLVTDIAHRKFRKQYPHTYHMTTKASLINRDLFPSSEKYFQQKLGRILLPRYSKKKANEKKVTEDTIKTKSGKWVNKGKEGTHGEFKTKKAADAQRKAIFASGWKESLNEDTDGVTKEDKKKIAKLCKEHIGLLKRLENR